MLQYAESFLVSSFGGFASEVNAMGCPFVTYTDGVLFIGDHIRVAGSGFVMYFDDTEIANTNINWRGAGSYGDKQYLAVSDTFLYFQVRGHFENRAAFVYELINNEPYYGIRASAGNSTMSYKQLTEIPMYKIGGTNDTYGHKQILNCTPDEGLLYTEDALFRSDVRTITDHNLVTCTYVPTQKKITFEGKDYFSLSNYHLFPMDT